jgi:hypothetical protein
VINPVSMTKMTITLPFLFQVGGATADAAGNIFAVGTRGDNHVYELDGSGNVVKSLSLGSVSGFLNGLQISNSGQLLTASNQGQVFLTDTNLTSFSTFSVGSEITTFAGFVTPVSAVPEPTSLTLLATGVGACGFLAVRRHRRP